MSEQIQNKSEVITGEAALDLANAIINSAANKQDSQLHEFVTEHEMYGAIEGGSYAQPEVEMGLKEPVKYANAYVFGDSQL